MRSLLKKSGDKIEFQVNQRLFHLPFVKNASPYIVFISKVSRFASMLTPHYVQTLKPWSAQPFAVEKVRQLSFNVRPTHSRFTTTASAGDLHPSKGLSLSET